MNQPPPATQTSPYASQSEHGRPDFPRKMLILTLACCVSIALCFALISYVEDLFGVGLDMVVLYSILASAVMLVLWIGWFLFVSGWKWTMRILASALLISVPVTLLAVFRPVTGGDVSILRFEPIWAERPEVSAADIETLSELVDLKTETADDFPRFLGPLQSGVAASGQSIDTAAFESSQMLWKQPIGKGWSAFAARNGFAVTMEQREDQECVTCYEIDSGELRWIYQHPTRHRDAMNMGHVGPRATPTIHDGLVYAVGAVGNFVCLNGSDGSVRWQVDLNANLGLSLISDEASDGYKIQYEDNSSLTWGRSGSPLIVEQTVVVPGGGTRDGKKITLLAFDRISGDPVWQGGSEMIAYGSPVRAVVGGVDQILMTAESQVMSFDPHNGNVLWHWPRPGNTGTSANTSQVTIVSDDQLLTSKGYSDGGGELIRLTTASGKLTPESVWKTEISLKTKLTSPVILDGYAYSLSNGFLECADISNEGQRVWKHRGHFGHGQILLVGTDLLVHGESGVLYLVRASPEGYQEIGTLPTIEGICWNTLCLYGDKLLVRSDIEAACIRIPIIR